MIKMLKTYKIEIKLTDEQKLKVNKSIGICKYLYNEMIATNELLYQQYKLGNSDKKFMSGMEFDKYVNNTLSKQLGWIKDCGSKARKSSIMNCDLAFKKFFKKKGGFPKYKKKNDSIGLYFPKNNSTDFTLERHRVKFPNTGYIRFKEFGYIPLNSNIKSGTITKQSNKYFINLLVDVGDSRGTAESIKSEPIGIDLGLKDFAIVSNNMKFKNINKSKKVKKLEKSLRRQQRSLSRKLNKNKLKEVKTANNIKKNILEIQRLNMRLGNTRVEYVRFVVNSLVKLSPQFIAIEDLNVKGMMKNRCLSKAISKQNFYYFRLFLTQQCNKSNIELRIVDRWFPSSKTCNCCGQIKTDLKLKDRVYKCDCGYTEDRDLNASFNIRDCSIYKIAN